MAGAGLVSWLSLGPAHWLHGRRDDRCDAGEDKELSEETGTDDTDTAVTAVTPPTHNKHTKE